MVIYPYSAPIILTDAIYHEYGGQDGASVIAQRQNAFWIAEKRVTEYVGTFLLPTIVTGTYPYNHQNFVATDYGYVHRILSASVLSLNNLQTCTLQTDTACVFVFNDTFGYLNLSCVNSICGCGGWLRPYQFQIAYEAGLPTGTANLAGVEHALVIMAELALNEMLYPRANESAGDRGVESWSAQEYSERRKSLKRTALGQSARANYASELLDISVKRAKRAITLR